MTVEPSGQTLADTPTADELVSFRRQIHRVVLNASPGVWDAEAVRAAEVLSAKTVDRIRVTGAAER